MPELPEVETVRRGLEKVTLGLAIRGGDVLHHRTIAHPAKPQSFLSGLEGMAIAHWQRRGKYLLAQLAQSSVLNSEASKLSQLIGHRENPSWGWLGIHLRMTGQLLWVTLDEPLHKHTRVRLFLGNTHELRFIDQRTFGQMWWVAPEEDPNEIISGLKALGPEPFSEGFCVEYLQQNLHRRQRPIKNALLDQSIIAGVGNIYADETLFLSGIRPTTLCCALTLKQIKRLHWALLRVLEAGLSEGGTTFSHFRNVLGINGNYSGVAWVYQRSGDPCRTCGTAIQRMKLAGRSTHFCPQCQQ